MEALAIHINLPSSPSKMRLVADLIRGQKVNKTLNILNYQQTPRAKVLDKLFFQPLPTGS